MIISVIGRGNTGKVYLVEYKKTSELYALKSIKKNLLIEDDQIKNIILEKNILKSLKHPFLCYLAFSFQTQEYIYFVMNYVKGGELFQHMKNFKYFEEDKVKFYAAQIGLALQYLHSNNLIYRDLKPENILMDQDGYLQIADFQMAKFLENGNKTKSFCGTPEYLAPEILRTEEYNFMVDWWSFGVLM